MKMLQSAMPALSQTTDPMCKAIHKGRDRWRLAKAAHTHSTPSSPDNKGDWTKSPRHFWPVATTRQLLLLLMSETERRRRPTSARLITPGRGEHAVFVIVCRWEIIRSNECENNRLSHLKTSARFLLPALQAYPCLYFPSVRIPKELSVHLGKLNDT